MACRWKFRPVRPDADPEALAAAVGVSPVLARLLADRGLTSAAELERFLCPGLRHLAPPSEAPGLVRAAEVLADGLTRGLPFAVWGDYDVDGVTAAALVKGFLEARGYAAEVFLPDRHVHGYGLHAGAIEELAARGIRLLLTVDCGITDLDEVRRANELGMTVVVSDHHLPGPELPPAAAVCDPRLADGPCADLAGVGVAFLLMGALNRLLPGEPVDVRPFLDLVALGSIADVVPLTGQNRILVKNGLLLIKEAKRPGMAALKAAASYDPLAALGAGQVGFGLAPRINAAGRLGDPGRALALLLAKTSEEARPLAAELDRLNSERRSAEDAILQEALVQAEAMVPPRGNRLGLVLAAEHWHPGVIGIVASRIAERHHRPALLLAGEEGRLKGSGRSIPEFDLHAGLAAVAHLLLTYGGHRQAAGLSLAPENLPALREAFDAAVAAQLGPQPLPASLTLDRVLSFADLNYELLKELELMQPFGMGNPEPVFASPPVRVREVKIFGKDHVKLTVVEESCNRTLTAKAWRKAEEFGAVRSGDLLELAFAPRIDRFNGAPVIELTLKDWRKAQ